MPYKPLANSTLSHMTKTEIIEVLRCAEHNARAFEESLNQHIENVKDWQPVTHCKDCKHKGWVQEPCHGKSMDYCKVWDCTLRNLETTFCSYGEYKEDGGA